MFESGQVLIPAIGCNSKLAEGSGAQIDRCAADEQPGQAVLQAGAGSGYNNQIDAIEPGRLRDHMRVWIGVTEFVQI